MAEREQAGFVVYFEIEPALDMLDDSNKGKLLSAMLNYAHYGVLPAFDDRLLQMAWAFIKPSIDRSNKRYIETQEKRKIAGIISHFKRNYAPKHGIDPDDEEAQQAYIRQRLSTDGDYVTGNGNQTGNQFGIETESEGEAGCGEGGLEGEPAPQNEQEIFEQKKRNAQALLQKYQ